MEKRENPKTIELTPLDVAKGKHMSLPSQRRQRHKNNNSNYHQDPLQGRNNKIQWNTPDLLDVEVSFSFGGNFLTNE